MTNLAAWLEANRSYLIDAMTVTLSSNVVLQTQVSRAVRAFHDDLAQAAITYSATPLYNILMDWVEARSIPTDEDPLSLMPILAKLKRTVNEHILKTCDTDTAISLLSAADNIFTDALVFVSQVEAEVLLSQMRVRVETATRELERVNKSKSDFIAIAGHELKTPLTVIEGYAGMIRYSPTMQSNPDLVAYASGIESGLHRLHDIIDDIIDVSMLELGLMQLTFQPVWFHHLLESVERVVRRAMTDRQLVLEIDADSFPTHATFGDNERLSQALQKVVMNAIKYTPDGGNIRVSARALPGFVDITVTDTGIGIAPERINHLFDAFSSGGNVSLHSSGKVKFKGGGPGLGLPIAKGIVQAHGGSIWVESAGYNEETCPGSTFHIMIPMRGEPPEIFSEAEEQYEE
jgi:signal transduction histidine kinase